MRRRTLLASLGVGTAGLAGCFGVGSQSTPTPGEGSTTPDGGDASFDLRRIRGPERVELGVPYEIRIEVANTGDRAGVYRAPVSVNAGDGVGFERVTSALVYVEPGETQAATVRLPPFEDIGTVDVRFGGPNDSWSVDVVGPRLPFGAAFDVDDLRVGYEDVALRDSYTASGSTYTAPEGSAFAVATVRIENREGSSRWMPNADRFSATVDGRRETPFTTAGYEVQILDVGERYVSELPFEVPADAAVDELVYRYDGQRQDRHAFWSGQY